MKLKARKFSLRIVKSDIMISNYSKYFNVDFFNIEKLLKSEKVLFEAFFFDPVSLIK